MSTDTSISSSNFSKLYKSRETILTILKQNGFSTDGYDNFSSSELHTMSKNKQMDMLLDNVDGSKIYIKYQCILGNKINDKNVKNIVDELYFTEFILGKNDCLFIVSNEDPNDTLVSYLKDIWEQEHIFIVIVSLQRLQFNILEHTLVPKHTILNDEEKLQMYKKFNIMSDNQLPEISRFDPVASVLCMRPDQVCKILRSSKTSITSNYYRICMNF